MLLWRRAIGDELGRTFCLVGADLLNYDISVKAEQELAQLMKGKSGKCTELKNKMVISECPVSTMFHVTYEEDD